MSESYFRCPYRPQVIARRITRAGVSITYPLITGMPGAVEANRLVLQALNQLIRDTRYPPEGKAEVHGRFFLRLNRACLLSLSQEVYSYVQGAAHGLTAVKSLNFDVLTGRPLRLEELFTPGTPWVEEINRQIKEQIQRRDIPLINPFESIGENPDFYLTDKDLVIYFQLYEYTPYYVGLPEFPIPLESLRPYIGPRSPLAPLLG